VILDVATGPVNSDVNRRPATWIREPAARLNQTMVNTPRALP
jgi:hypothetical protein